jgi:hypothetical protein
MGRLMSTIYARMEEMSFRSGAAVAAGAVAAAGTAIALPMVLAGHSAAAISAPVPSATVRMTAPPSPVLPIASPSVKARVTAEASRMPAGAYRPPAPVTAATTPRAPAADLPTPRLTRPPADPRYYAPWPWSPPWGWNPLWP